MSELIKQQHTQQPDREVYTGGYTEERGMYREGYTKGVIQRGYTGWGMHGRRSTGGGGGGGGGDGQGE